MKCNFNINRIRFREGGGQRSESRIVVICVTGGKGQGAAWGGRGKLAWGEPGAPARRDGRDPVAPLNDPQELAYLLQFRKQFFFRQKLLRMHASPAPPQSDRVLQMQHLVK